MYSEIISCSCSVTEIMHISILDHRIYILYILFKYAVEFRWCWISHNLFLLQKYWIAMFPNFFNFDLYLQYKDDIKYKIENIWVDQMCPRFPDFNFIARVHLLFSKDIFDPRERFSFSNIFLNWSFGWVGALSNNINIIKSVSRWT